MERRQKSCTMLRLSNAPHELRRPFKGNKKHVCKPVTGQRKGLANMEW
jgi:hypothetical protein